MGLYVVFGLFCFRMEFIVWFWILKCCDFGVEFWFYVCSGGLGWDMILYLNLCFEGLVVCFLVKIIRDFVDIFFLNIFWYNL